MRQAEAWNPGTGFCLPGPLMVHGGTAWPGRRVVAEGAGGPGCIRGRAGPCLTTVSIALRAATAFVLAASVTGMAAGWAGADLTGIAGAPSASGNPLRSPPTNLAARARSPGSTTGTTAAAPRNCRFRSLPAISARSDNHGSAMDQGQHDHSLRLEKLPHEPGAVRRGRYRGRFIRHVVRGFWVAGPAVVRAASSAVTAVASGAPIRRKIAAARPSWARAVVRSAAAMAQAAQSGQRVRLVPGSADGTGQFQGLLVMRPRPGGLTPEAGTASLSH